MTYLAFDPWGGRHTHRPRKAHGLSRDFHWSSVRGPYASPRLPGGFRIGHVLARQRDH